MADHTPTHTSTGTGTGTGRSTGLPNDPARSQQRMDLADEVEYDDLVVSFFSWNYMIGSIVMVLGVVLPISYMFRKLSHGYHRA